MQRTGQLRLDGPQTGVDNRVEGRIRELDGWRAVSVVLVLLHHLFSIQYYNVLRNVHLLFHVFGMCGFLGVDTFFVISGFVICRLLILEEQRYGSISLRGFYCRRIFRILPPLYLYLAALVVLRLTGVINENWVPIALGASFLYDLSFVPQGWYVSHMWSLAVEEQFYLLCPLLLLLCRPRRRGRVFGCLFALCIAWNLVLPLLGEPNPVIDSRTRAGFACICFGVLTAIYEQRARSIAVRTSGWMVAALAFILLLHPVPQGRVNEALFSAIFTPFAIALILTYSLEHNGWLKVLLCAKPIQSVGITSYGVYLWQQIFTGPLVIYSGAGAIIPYLLPALIAIVPISYFVVEKPAMRLGKSLSAAVQSKRRLPEQRAEAVASIPHDLILPAKRTP